MSASEHRAIVKAIASGDAEAAGRAMRQHVLDSKLRTQRNNSGNHGGHGNGTPSSNPSAPAPAAAPRKKVTHA